MKVSVIKYMAVAWLCFWMPAAAADISGKVFRDFNANGVFDTSATFNEVGAGGVTVKAFDASGIEKASITSMADGSYVLAYYCVESSWGDTWLKPGAAGGTSVQFVRDGATGVDLVVSVPDEYSDTWPAGHCPECRWHDRQQRHHRLA